MDDQAVKRAGLLINPSSGKSSGKGLSLVDMLNNNAAVSVRVLERFEQLTGFLDEFASDGVTDLFISSGDGTIHAVQTDLVERRPFKVIPRLSLLPHGTTNMTAADLGFPFSGPRNRGCWFPASSVWQRAARGGAHIWRAGAGRPTPSRHSRRLVERCSRRRG